MAKDAVTGKPACPAAAQPYLPLVDGKAFSFACGATIGKPDPGDCRLTIESFPLVFDGTCSAAGCEGSPGAGLMVDWTGAQPRNWSTLAACVPVAALVALCALASLNLAAMGGGMGERRVGGNASGNGCLDGLCCGRRGGANAVAPPPPPPPPPPQAAVVDGPAWGSLGPPAAAATTSTTLPPPRLPGTGPHIAELAWSYVTVTVPLQGARAIAAARAAAARAAAPGGVEAGGGAVDGGGPKPPHVTGGGALKRPALPPLSRPRIPILSNLAGRARAGSLVGLLGPSGCGKTTLLGVLAADPATLSSAAHVTGSVTWDGSPRPRWGRRGVAYVPQFDFLLPSLTVAETLRYSARLRLPPATPRSTIDAAVDATLATLRLTDVAHSRVGGGGGGGGDASSTTGAGVGMSGGDAAGGGARVSGGERRRVAIGLELVIDPAVLLLDEPTSGLDSHTALQIMRALSDHARSGRIVLLSFHQPGAAMFNSLLDFAYVLAKGKTMFAGHPSTAAAALAAARSHEPGPCGEVPPSGASDAERLLTAAADPAVAGRMAAAVAAGGGGGGGGGGGDDGPPFITPKAVAPPPLPPPRPPRAQELAVLFWRAGTEVARNPALLLMHCALGAGAGLLCGGIFYKMGTDLAGAQVRRGREGGDAGGAWRGVGEGRAGHSAKHTTLNAIPFFIHATAQGRLGAIFFALTLMALTSLTTVDLLIAERGLVIREVAGGYYR